MRYLGSTNNLTSWYIIGAELPLNKNLTFPKTLEIWMNFKDNDWGMEKYRTQKTQHIFTMEIIDLRLLKELFIDLMRIYKNDFPFAEKEDFISHVFSETISDLTDLVEGEYSFLSEVHKTDFDVYYKKCTRNKEYIDFIIDADKNFDYYKQYAKKVLKLIEDLDFDNLNNNDLAIIKTKINDKAIEAKPIFKPEMIETIFDLLKDFFSIEQQKDFKTFLETGNNVNEKLLFLDNGNRLADAFKQLKNANFITGCNQSELINCIEKNFKYRFRDKVKNYIPKYLESIISTNKELCKKPIITVKANSITKNIISR